MINLETEYSRSLLRMLVARLREPRRFLQVLVGPRQTGKTTLARQAMAKMSLSHHFASADEPTLRDRHWIVEQWEVGRLRAREGGSRGAILVLDEAQKVADWSEVVKRLWDEDSAARLPLRVLILGSSPLLVQRGLTESLAGRFEVIRVPHWSFMEMRDAFGWTFDQYVYYGGYPGSAALIEDRGRWARYVLDSLVETTLSRDILLLTRVDKPALLRRLFHLACDYSGQILSFQKMIGQLQDVGNTVTLAHYLDLLSGAGLVMGLQKFSKRSVQERASSPKLLALNTALITALSGLTLDETRRDPSVWGRLVESAVGAHLVNSSVGNDVEVYYWRERNREVDFVLRRGKEIVGIEVTSGRRKDHLPGLEAFSKEFHVRRTLLFGGQGVPLEEALLKPAAAWM